MQGVACAAVSAAQPPLFSQRAHADAPWEPYEPAFSLAIADAIEISPDGGYIWCPFANGNTFQVRWGAEACSARMPSPPSSGMVQVNVNNDNTRVAQREGATDPDAAWRAKTSAVGEAKSAKVGSSDQPVFCHRQDWDAPWEPYPPELCVGLANRIVDSPTGGRIWCDYLGDGQTFQIRWGNEARSRKIPETPSTGMVQCNVLTQNTRVVERQGQ
eukprot:SAG31_NODE_14541_length_800_cov_1.326676_1_plen_214_part_01